MKKLIAFIAVVLLIGCSRQEVPLPTEAPVQSVARVADSAKGAEAGALAPGVTVPQPMIVRRAEMRIIAGDTTKVVDAVTKAAESAGGYVSDSSIWREGELLRAKLTLRVPSAKLTSTLASIRALAKRVDNETITSEDVSQEYVDLESRVRNLEATETELLELLKVARVNSRKATDVLEVHQQLSSIRGEIEQVRGRMRYLSQVTAMSSIGVEVVPDAITKPVVEPGWRPLVVAKDASRALVGVMQFFATAAIWFVIYVLPIVGILALMIVGAWKLSRRSRAKEA